MSHFERVVLAAVIALALLAGGLSVAAARLGPTAGSLTTAQMLDGASVNTQIGVTFSEPMNLHSVERNFSISPHTPGDFSWAGNELLYLPRQPLRYDTRYSVAVGQGARAAAGKALERSFHGSFTTQSEHLVYLGTQGAERNHLVLASVNGERQVIGGTDGAVTDFSLSFDRSLIVYVKRPSGRARPDQLWLLSLTDNSSQRIFSQADWTITQPHFSPDGRYVVFLATNVRLCQKYYGCYRDTSGPVVYLYDLRARKLAPFSSATDVPITNFIDFSPAGQVAYTDLGSALTLANPDGNQVIHIPNRGNSLEFSAFDSTGEKAAFVGQTPSSTGGDILVYDRGSYVDVSKGVYDSSEPSFSSSGKQLAYSGYRGERGIQPIYGINVYNFAEKRTTHLTFEKRWSDWAPQWSPDDRYISFIRSVPQEAMYMGAGEVWVMKSNGTKARPLGAAGTDVQWAL